MTVSIEDHGARPEAGHKNTRAIQAAIDACADKGGGTVVIPSGEFVSGPLRLRSNIHLYLEPGAVLQASPDVRDYGGQPGRKGSGVFLSAIKAHNVALTGSGTIRGNGQANFRGKDPRRGTLDPVPSFRVKLVGFDQCTDVRLRDVTLQESDAWTLHLRRCNRVWLDGLAILNNVHRMNSDGIDPDSCRNVHISNCHIVAGDDCIVLKTTGPEPCEDIVVTNCTLETTCTAIKFGTESQGDFRNIHIANCVIRNSSSGIAFHMKDGAVMERIVLANISYEERADDPVRYCSSPLLMDIERRHPETQPGVIRDVTIRDFYAEARVGILIQGMPESPIRNLDLRNIHLHVDKPWDFNDRHKRIAGIRTTQDQRDTLHARKPAYATLAHIDNVTVDGLHIEIAEEIFRANPRSALWLEHVRREYLTNIRRTPEAAAREAIIVNQGES